MKHNKQTVRSTYCRFNSKDKQRVIPKHNLLGLSDKEQCGMALIVWRAQCQKKTFAVVTRWNKAYGAGQKKYL